MALFFWKSLTGKQRHYYEWNCLNFETFEIFEVLKLVWFGMVCYGLVFIVQTCPDFSRSIQTYLDSILTNQNEKKLFLIVLYRLIFKYYCFVQTDCFLIFTLCVQDYFIFKYYCFSLFYINWWFVLLVLYTQMFYMFSICVAD